MFPDRMIPDLGYKEQGPKPQPGVCFRAPFQSQSPVQPWLRGWGTWLYPVVGLTESPATSEQDAGKIEHSCIPGGPRTQSWLKTDPAFKHRSFHAVLLWSRAIGKWCFFGLYWGFHSASLGYVHSNACCLSQDSLLLDWVTRIHNSRSEFTGGHQFVVELTTNTKECS